MSHDESLINGSLLRLRREERGWALSDMATRACMSVKQIKQLEDGGMSSFYSEAVKVTAAKKMGAILGLSPEEVFGLPAPESVESSEVHEARSTSTSTHDQADKDSASITESRTIEKLDSEHEVSAPSESSASNQEAPKSKTSIWMIAAIFAAALAVAAYMQPEDEKVSEPAPPLQVIPTEAVEAASSAASAASTAASDVTSSASAASNASAAPLPTAASPVSVASASARTASTAAVATPAASAASAK